MCSIIGLELRKGMYFNFSNVWYKGCVVKLFIYLVIIMVIMIGNKNWMLFVIFICEKERKEFMNVNKIKIKMVGVLCRI